MLRAAARVFARFDRLFLGIVTASLLFTVAVPTFGAAHTPTADDFSHFAYDNTVPLDVKQVSSKDRGGVTIQEITYSGSNGDTVPAYLVVPKQSGKFAAIIWGHWLMPDAANSNRDEFLDEAVALASKGVVSLLIDAPQKRTDFKPAANPALVAQEVVDLRRGLDLLLMRSDIDKTRVAYVGHSWNAGTGAILDAVDKRFAAFVFMGGPQSTMQYVMSSDSPRMVSQRKQFDMAKVEQTLKANAWSDPGSYTEKLGPAPALFQYGLHDEEWVPLADAKDYVAKSTGPKTVDFYDAGHALNEKARVDRDEFLRERLKVGR
jgi:cephalosporin-C deacetylase-like acetyl esterase